MEIVSCTPEDLADAFAEWERRYRASLPRPRWSIRQAPELYGVACAPFFRQLLGEAGRDSSDPLRRALALGWTPPPPDGDRFWYHPDHGPVHQDDLAGVLGGLRVMAGASPQFDARGEGGYRRGYQHGWQHALHAMRLLLRAGQTIGAACRACTEFNNGELSEWRFGDCARRETPPAFGQAAEGPLPLPK